MPAILATVDADRDNAVALAPVDSTSSQPRVKQGLGGWMCQGGRGCWSLIRWFPWTPRAVLAGGILGALLKWVALPRNDQILLAVCIGGLALIGLCTVLVAVAAVWLGLRKQPAAKERLAFEAGSAFATGYTLGRIHWMPLLQFAIAWEKPEGVQVKLIPGPGGFREEVTADQRTFSKEVVRRLTITDVFGLVRFGVRRRLAQAIAIQPDRGQLPPLPLLAQNVTGDQIGHPQGKPGGDLIEMRPYAPGDPLKLVLWKVYARTGRMLVRMPERAVSPSERTLAYVVAGQEDEPTAGIARAVLENGALGNDFLFGADGTEQPTRDVREGNEQIMRSAAARPNGGLRLEGFLAQGASQGIHACLLFVPAKPGEWLARVAGQVAQSVGPFRVIIGVDGIHAVRPRWTLKKLLVRAEVLAGSALAGVKQVAQVLQQAGADVTVRNRTTGEAVSAADLPRLD